MSRETRRHPIDPHLQILSVSKKSIVSQNKTQKNTCKNSSVSKSKQKADRHI